MSEGLKCAPMLQVKWTQGATQGGSSGAALIDADTRKVVGVLTGGTTTCDIFSGADYFGMLSVVRCCFTHVASACAICTFSAESCLPWHRLA